jgi:hypothetical protein
MNTYYAELAAATVNGTMPPPMPTTTIPATIPGPVGSRVYAPVFPLISSLFHTQLLLII